MQTIDLVFLALYFMLVAGVGWWASRRNQEDSSSYFLAGRGVGWGAIGASLFASNISAEHFIGLAGSGAASGLAVGQFEWLACFILLLLGWLFVPFYLKTGVFTMPEFLERRFSPACRRYLSVISLAAYVFTKVSVAVYAGALVLQTILGWNIWVGALVLIVSTGAYTLFGGLLAVLYTDFLQAFILIGGGTALTYLAVSAVPEALGADGGGFLAGLTALHQQLPPESFSVWHGSGHPDFPWTGILFGAPILGIWYWCTDQMIVQRTLAAKNVEEARTATLFAGFLKILPVFILVLPGLAGSVLYPGVEPNEMYATMVDRLLPPGLKGLVVAGLLAALMSSLSSVFNSSSTLVVMDFYREWKPEAPEKELVRAGQVATLVLVVIGLIWIPFVGLMSDQLFVYLQSVQAYVSPPIATVFLLGILWRRANATGALTTLLVGFVLGAARFATEIAVKAGWTDAAWAQAYAGINFLHFAVLLALVSVVVLVATSLATAPPTAAQVALLDPLEEPVEDEATRAAAAGARRRNQVLSVLLVAIILAFWVAFSPLFFS